MCVKRNIDTHVDTKTKQSTLTLKQTVGDEDDGVPSYFIRAVGACPPVTLNHHSHCRPYKLKLHLLPPSPPSPFLSH